MATSSKRDFPDHHKNDEKEEEKQLKRKNMLTEERRARIAANQALLTSTEDHIRIKQLRINKLKNSNDFKKCDEVSSELRELLKEKGRIDSQLEIAMVELKKSLMEQNQCCYS